ncbi:MAG: thioredoxin [Armatimonadia bacterium]|nr:thioredoxin [Armatimonadia bacterium]
MTRREALCYWTPPVVWAGIILVGTSLPKVPGPNVVGIDKVSHLVAYGILGVLLVRGFRYCQCWRYGRAAAWTLIVGGLFGAFDELHQSWIPGRSTDLLDFAADFAGLTLAVAAVWTWDRLSTHEDVSESVDHAQTAIEGANTRKEMSTMAEALHLDQEDFESEVLQSDKPALVDFWAPWCGPCQMMGPTIDKLAGDYEGKAVIAKVNVDDSPDLASKYGIRSIPALLFFKDGEVADQLVGVQSEDQLKEKLDSMA